MNPSYLFAKRVKLFFNYSTGFKAPTLSELYGQFGHNENLKPEESNSIESGIQFLPANKISARVTFFKRDIKDAIVYTFAGGYINQNRQKDHGIETEASVDLFKDLSLRAFYAFVDGKITDKTTTGKDTVYFNLIRRPKHSFGLSLGYQVTSELYLSTHLSAYSKRVDLFYNPANFYAAEEVKLQSYVLLDLYAEYKLWKDKLKLFADAKNITNSRYTEVYGYSTPGFNVIGGLSIKL